MPTKSSIVLPIIVLSQFCCVSIWFAGNGVMSDLVSTYLLPENALGHLTSSVQFGFITGTLVFAILTIADRFSPSKVFLLSALIGSFFNLGIIWNGNGFLSLMVLRFCTGFFLAGIYPVGMKIAADHFDKGLGKSLGYLVGALVIGTAFPHFLKGIGGYLPWKYVFITTSLLAVFGGLLIYFLVPNGPFRKAGQKIDFSAFLSVFENKNFRSAAFGYFGHMWELYAFWAFVPVMLFSYQKQHTLDHINVSLWSFYIIGIGGLSCVVGGYIAQIKGTKSTATLSLTLSCICCLTFPLIFYINLPFLFLIFLLFWGMVVIADSPLFSTLVAQNAIPEKKGTALTMVNCIGFSITIISIQVLTLFIEWTDSPTIFMLLAIGPILGLNALKPK
jgi:MFS family permease